MRITRLEIDGFGRFHDAAFTLPAGLTVLHGANEAGKTTLLNALRALLFGFESSREGRAWYPALAGGRRGGRLVLETANGERWTVERHGERGGTGALAVRAPNGNQGGQETLDRLLHGADKDLFNNIFAFGLGELQTFASLSADGVRGRIYGAGTGLGGTSALDLERRIRQQLDATFLPRGSQRPLNQLLARIEELRREVADLSRQPEEHAAAARELDEVRRTAAALHADAGKARERRIRLQHLRDAVPLAADLAVLETELAAGDAGLDTLPDDAVTRLDGLLADAAEARAVLSTIDEQLGDARRARSAITIDEPMLAAADEIGAMVELRATRAAAEGRRRDLTTAAERQAAVVAEQLARVGGWGEPRLVAVDDSIAQVEATREHESRLAQARSRQAEAEQRLRAAREQVRSVGPNRSETEPVPEDLESRLAAFHELNAIALAGAAPASTLSRPAALPAVGAAAAFTAALAVGVGLGAPIPGLVAGVVLAAVAWAVLTRSASPSSAGGGPRREELLMRAGLSASATPAEVAAGWEELTTRRARLGVAGEQRARVAALADEVERRERDVAETASELEATEEAWRTWLVGAGLPGDVSPDAARHLLAAAGLARRAAEERDRLRRELALLDDEDAGYRDRVDRLCARLSLGPSADDAAREARLAGLAERLDHARADQRQARELDTRIEQLAARSGAARQKADERQQRVEVYLASIGSPDAETVRQRAIAAKARRELRTRVRERRERLAGIAGGPSQVDELLAEAHGLDPAALEARELEAGAELADLEERERAANHRIGALEARLRELEAAEDLGARRQELAVLEGRAASMARDWAVHALALRLLEETRSRYERERQPEVVREAEAHFERITAGRYARIVAPPGVASVRVETDGGESRAVDELSRGTAEQLYLALRFGLIEEFARTAEPLPVVMDDILVNFDPDRAARAASAIEDLAERHQVLFFTCHRSTAQLLDPDGGRTLALEAAARIG